MVALQARSCHGIICRPIVDAQFSQTKLKSSFCAGPWFRLSNLTYADVLDLPATVRELLGRGYLLSSCQSPARSHHTTPAVEEGYRNEPTNGGRFSDSAAGTAKTARERSCDVTAGRDHTKPTPSVGGSGDGMGAKSRRRSLRLAEGSQGLEVFGEKGKRDQELKTSGQEVRTGALQGLGEVGVGGDERQGSKPKWNPRAPEMRDEGYVCERLAVLNVGELRELLCALGLKV